MIKIVQRRTLPGFTNNDTFCNYYTYYENGLDLALLECGYEKCDPNHYWAGKKGFHIIHFIISGKGTLSIEGQQYTLKAGEGFYISPDQEVLYTADADDPWEYRWLGFTGTRAVIVLNATHLVRSQTFQLKDISVYIERLKQIYAYATLKTERGECMALGQLYFFLAELLEGFEEKDRRSDASAQYVNMAITMIAEKYQQEFGVSDICKQLNITRSYLYKLFMRYYSVSPSDYLLKFRLEKARELLAGNLYPVNNVAEQTGFCSHAYFTKRFREAYGTTPREYAQSLRKEIV